jgi:hypothetical protein
MATTGSTPKYSEMAAPARAHDTLFDVAPHMRVKRIQLEDKHSQIEARAHWNKRHFSCGKIGERA